MSTHIITHPESQFLLTRTIVSLILAIVIFISTQIIIEEWNPDWFAYYKIFEDGGWGEGRDKDIGFSFIISLFKIIIGNDYELFRIFVAVYLSIFSLVLARGLILTQSSVASAFVVAVAIFSLMIVRSTIQIREGIAITFVLYSFVRMFNIIGEKNSSFHINVDWKIITLLVIAFFIHSGTLIFLALYFLACFFSPIRQRSIKSIVLLEFLVAVIVFAIAIGFGFSYNLLVSDNTVFFGGMDLDETTNFTVGKLGYWTVYGFFVFMLRHRMLEYCDNSNLPHIAVTYLKLFAGIIMPIVYSLILVLIFFQSSSLITGAMSRLLNLTMGINILVLAFKTRNSLFIILFSLFFIIDQVRIVIDALLSYDMIDL